jgi:hypothetical protein
MSNQFVNQFLDIARERFSLDSLNMPMSEWICKNTTLRNRPFSFKGYEFQRKIVDDMHPDLDVIKISQVGMTEIQIRKALGFLVRNNGTSLIFSLPNEDMYKRVSNSRVKPIINKDKVFNTPQDKEAKATRSVDMQQFGQSFLYLVPAIESAATSIPADFLMNDELDLSDQQMISLFNSRMQNSAYKISQRFSTPSFPSFGIDLNWRVSDQHFYMCKCDHCGHWQHPEFSPEFVHLPGLPEKALTEVEDTFRDTLDFVNSYIKCEKCHQPLDLGNPENREWVPKYPNRTSKRGYRIGPFSTGKLDLQYIYNSLWEFKKNEYVRGFHNTVLGLPYSDGNIQIPEEDIVACMTEQTSAPDMKNMDHLWVGIDMGQVCHVTLGRSADDGKIEIVSMYQVHVRDIVEHCKDLVTKYKVRGGAVDRHPYEPTAREIFKVTKGKILPVEYRGQKDTNLVYDEYEDLSHGQVNPTWFLDNFASHVRKRMLRIMGYGYQKRVIIEHFRDMVREEKPGEPAKWQKLTGNDHYLHSAAFMCLGPVLFDLIRLKSKEDQRTMTLGMSAKMSDSTSNLIGIGKKRVDYNPLNR